MRSELNGRATFRAPREEIEMPQRVVKPQQHIERPALLEVGQIFELTARTKITGLGMVESFGHNSEGWRFEGKLVPVGTTGSFKFISGRSEFGVGFEFEKVIRKCCQEGNIPSGIWLKVFDEARLVLNSVGCPIGIPDASWTDTSRSRRFPTIKHGHRGFGWMRPGNFYCPAFDGYWLVQV